jgi:ATP-dependent Clp protease ATP-binding subunit ClpA
VFDAFTDQTRRVIACAHRHALAFGHDYIGSEHLLLGVLEVADPLVDGLLAHQAIPKAAIVARIEALLPVRVVTDPSKPMPFAPQAKRILERAAESAKAERATTVEPGHLLEAMVLHEQDSIATQLLLDLGWNTESAARWVAARARGDEAPAAPRPSTPASEPMPREFVSGPHFDHLTDRSCRALWQTQLLAEQLRSPAITPALLLAGLLREGEGVAATALTNLGVDLRAFGDTIVAGIAAGAGDTPRPCPLAPACERALVVARRRAYDLGHPYVGTEHLLLGLAAEPAIEPLLRAVGAPAERVLAELLALLGQARQDPR